MDIALVTQLQSVSYVKVSCLALLIYDIVIKLDSEFQHIWSANWTYIKILYLFTRYLPLIDTSITFRIWINVDGQSCNVFETVVTILAALGIGVAEIILMARTYALYNCSKKILIVFISLWLVFAAVVAWSVSTWSSPRIPAGGGIQCNFGSSSSSGLGNYLTLMVSETLVVLLTIWRAVSLFYRDGIKPTSLLRSFYRDGIFYYISLLPLIVSNIVVVIVDPLGPHPNLINTLLRVIHSILACRLILHLRELNAIDQSVQTI
ncbi:hypothetical protein K435DRAFT_202205 [Dendrothele bispora CBS 962.96]|uniref:DUF6533 domain-containing protein n=1 Tax=Dendrothele bispora (strain CBS 962.96) TaxID=1314807 RepID=A0A4S8MN80_DENBC|nr:hypothetical protein K435DRAFT_202205 [Dendrothele bispora CBS 962.96]